MKERTFFTVLFSIIALCIILTIVHFVYAIYAYNHCSIIPFIGKELW